MSLCIVDIFGKLWLWHCNPGCSSQFKSASKCHRVPRPILHHRVSQFEQNVSGSISKQPGICRQYSTSKTPDGNAIAGPPPPPRIMAPVCSSGVELPPHEFTLGRPHMDRRLQPQPSPHNHISRPHLFISV